MTTEVTIPPTKTKAPWRGRKRVKDARTKVISTIRCTEEERVAITAAADHAGLSVSAFVRLVALGDAGPRAVRRPPIERRELARFLGHLGKVGSNLNQLAHAFNRDRRIPGLDELNAMRAHVGELRDALMEALGRAGHPGDH
jgi:uncharacterized protein (DUF1778 family)